MNLNGKQIISIIMAILGVLMISKSQLTPMFGPDAAEYVVNATGLVNMMLASVMAAITGTMSQKQQVEQVLDMPGVERLRINKNASPELATLAMDPNVNKISPTDEARSAVAATAAKAS